MIDVLGWIIVALGLLATGYALSRAIRNLPLDDPLLFGVVALEVLLIVQMVVGIVGVTSTDRDLDTVTLIAYLIGVVLIVPIGAVWALVERSRYGPAVLALATFSASVMTLRVLQLWNGGTLV
jgi:NAD/NADP transhydrogenase beta subunit